MLYRTEITQNGRKIYSETMLGAQPGQVLRKAIESLKNRIIFAMAYILNEVGELWSYTLRKLGQEVRVELISHSRHQFSPSMTISILSGAKSLG